MKVKASFLSFIPAPIPLITVSCNSFQKNVLMLTFTSYMHLLIGSCKNVTHLLLLVLLTLEDTELPYSFHRDILIPSYGFTVILLTCPLLLNTDVSSCKTM